MKKKFQIKTFIISIAIPFFVAFISYLLFKNDINSYSNLNKPFLAPPPIVFNIVWPILYLLMGISAYIIETSTKAVTNDLDYNIHKKHSALKIYYIQLFFNIVWPILFFRNRLYFISFLDLIILLSLVVVMFFKFYSIDKTAALLQIPYILWLTFAGYLNFSVYLLNEAL